MSQVRGNGDIETDSAYEDIGYRRNWKLDKKYPLKQTVSPNVEKLKIEYLSGPMKDRTCMIRRDIAEDLIRRGMAREVR
jgi:hypothetical protein